jgi:excinuclease UvrABC nuclease subunit
MREKRTIPFLQQKRPPDQCLCLPIKSNPNVEKKSEQDSREFVDKIFDFLDGRIFFLFEKTAM